MGKTYVILRKGFEYNDEGYDPTGYHDVVAASSTMEGAIALRNKLDLDYARESDDIDMLASASRAARRYNSGDDGQIETALKVVGVPIRDSGQWGTTYNISKATDDQLRRVMDLHGISFHSIREVESVD